MEETPRKFSSKADNILSGNQTKIIPLYRIASLDQTHKDHFNGKSSLITPTYESIDVSKLIDLHQESFHVPENLTSSGNCGIGLYTTSSQATSDAHDGSSGCVSDNPIITVPENHYLYPFESGNHQLEQRTQSYGDFSTKETKRFFRNYSKYQSPENFFSRSLRLDCITNIEIDREKLSQFSSNIQMNRNILNQNEFDIFDALSSIISLITILSCTGLAYLLAYFLWNYEKDYFLFYFTIATTLLPSILTNLISLTWFLMDRHHQQNYRIDRNQQSIDEFSIIDEIKMSTSGTIFRISMHFVLMGPVMRFLDLIRYGVKSWSYKRNRINHKLDSNRASSIALSSEIPTSLYLNTNLGCTLPNFEPNKNKKFSKTVRNDYHLLSIIKDRDASLLFLYHCLMQCTIQMILHLHSLLCHWNFEHHHHLSDYKHIYTEYLQIAFILSLLIATSWSITSYHRALRRASCTKHNLSALGAFTQLLWHATSFSSRILAIALFLNQFGFWLLPIGIGHWGVMTIYVMHQGTYFSDPYQNHSNCCSEYFFNMLVGLIYLFVFIDLKDEPSRYRYLSFYAIILIENVSFASLWFLRIRDYYWPLSLPLLIIVPILFGLSVIFMLIYYHFLHPNVKNGVRK